MSLQQTKNFCSYFSHLHAYVYCCIDFTFTHIGFYMHTCTVAQTSHSPIQAFTCIRVLLHRIHIHPYRLLHAYVYTVAQNPHSPIKAFFTQIFSARNQRGFAREPEFFSLRQMKYILFVGENAADEIKMRQAISKKSDYVYMSSRQEPVLHKSPGKGSSVICRI